MKIDQEIASQDSGLPEIVARIRDTLRRRWMVMAAVTAVILALGVALVLMMTPQYSTEARVRIDPARNPLQEKRQVQDALSPEAIETEVSSINSLDLARKVVRSLHLDMDPEFTKGIEAPQGMTLTAADRETAVAGNVLNKLNVGRDKLTYILSIGFTSRDAQTSARVANAFAAAYIAGKVGSDAGTAEKQAVFFRQQLEKLGAEIRDADARVAQYRASAGISESNTLTSRGMTVTDQQISPLSAQLADAQSQAAAANAALRAASAQAASGSRNSVSEVLASPVIGDLRRQRAEVLRNMGEIQARYGERHPEAIKVRDQLASLDEQIRDETDRVLGSLRSTAAAASARASSLQATMDGLAAKQANNTRAAVLADSLQREADAKRDQYEKLSQMSLESTQNANNQIAQAEIVESAKVPTRPTSPNKPLLLALALVIGLAVGGGTIAVQEMLVTGFHSKDEVESYLDIPLLAAVPAVPKERNPADLLIDKPTSLFSESFRIMRASLLGVRAESAPQVIAFTSALPSEGKTTTALAFSRMLAINGAKTLLMECDVRRAIMRHSVRNAPTGPGLVEVLTGEAPLDQAIHKGDVEGLDHLLVSDPHFSAGDLFGDGKMEKLLAELRGRYGQIVLDLPPLLGLADGRFIAALADTTALVIRWNRTPVTATASALDWLRADGIKVSGAILSMIDPGAEAAGGLYYSKEYSGYYQKN